MKQITGIWQDARGNMAAYGVLHAQLNQDANVVDATQTAPRSVVFPLDISGDLASSAQIWANDELTPSGTYYTLAVCAYGGGVIWGPVRLVISGTAPINLNAMIPVSTIPPSDTAAAAALYREIERLSEDFIREQWRKLP